MNSDTTELLRALDAVKQHLPRMVDDVLLGGMAPDRQHEFADLLIELGRLLHRDAATQPEPPRNAPDVVAREEEQP